MSGKGILSAVIAGSIAWAVILLTLWALFIYEPASTTCSTGPFDVYAVRDGLQVVACP